MNKRKRNKRDSSEAEKPQDVNPGIAGAEAFAEGSSFARLSYLADAEIKTRPEDRFNRWPFAERIAHTISNHQDASSIVIGIYGAWGEGKTSLLNLITEALKPDQHVVCVRFNPWSFQSESALMLDFFRTLAAGLEKKLTTHKEEMGHLLQGLGTLLSATKGLLPSALDLSGAAEAVGQHLSSVSVDDRRKRIEQILMENRTRVVVMMDDIDRLDRIEIQLIFKLIKVSADFPFTVYVLAFDEKMVAGALGEKYGEGNQEAGRSFIEKIIQVPLYLPHVRREMLCQYCLADVWKVFAVNEVALEQGEQGEFAHIFEAAFGPRMKTPRMAKRYSNALMFALPILRGEVNPFDVALIEGIRIFYPRLYESIRDNPQVFLVQPLESLVSLEQKQKSALDLIQAALEGLTEGEIKAARSLLEALFPKLAAILRRTPYLMESRPEWRLQQRIASPWYFNRYFGYAVPEGQLQDQDILSFLTLVKSVDADGVHTEMARFIETGAGGQLFIALQLRIDSLHEDVARILINEIHSFGPLLASQSTSDAQEQAGFLIAELLGRLPSEEEQYQVARQVVGEAEPVRFAVECLWRIASTLGFRPRLLTPEHEKELASQLATRIQSMAHQTNILQQLPHEAGALLEMWAKGRSRDETNDYIRAELQRNPTMCIEVLKLFTVRVIGPPRGMLRWPSYSDTDYNRLAAVVDPEIVSDGLRVLYGSWLDETLTSVINISEEQVLAHNFVELHQARARQDQEAITSQGGAANHSETYPDQS